MDWRIIKIAAFTAVTVFLQCMVVFWSLNHKIAVAYPIDITMPSARIMIEIYAIPDIDQEIAAIELPRSLLHRSTEKITLSERDFECLARNIFYEAGIESYEGKIAVAQVTYNRLQSRRWGRSICSVVYAPHQFSWTADSTKRNRRPHGRLWQESQAAARDFVAGARVNRLSNSQHYHADYVSPRWGRAEHRIKQIGAHIFYDLSQPQNVAQKQQ